MSYNRKITEYALLPNGAFPVDARSHFESFAEANDVIRGGEYGNITTVELASENGNEEKRFYVGQIITTTSDGTYQVVATPNIFYNNVPNYTVVFTVSNGIGKGVYNIKVVTDSNNIFTGNTNSFRYNAEDKAVANGEYVRLYTPLDSYLLVNVGALSLSESKNVSFTANLKNLKWLKNYYLIPFGGGGSSGGGTLNLNVTSPLHYDVSETKLTLKLDSGSPLTVNASKELTLSLDTNTLKVDDSSGTKKLTLNIASNAPFTTTNGLSLAIDNNGGLKQNGSNELYVEGIHKTIKKTDTVDNIKVNNYIYQEI